MFNSYKKKKEKKKCVPFINTELDKHYSESVQKYDNVLMNALSPTRMNDIILLFYIIFIIT